MDLSQYDWYPDKTPQWYAHTGKHISGLWEGLPASQGERPQGTPALQGLLTLPLNPTKRKLSSFRPHSLRFFLSTDKHTRQKRKHFPEEIARYTLIYIPHPPAQFHKTGKKKKCVWSPVTMEWLNAELGYVLSILSSKGYVLKVMSEVHVFSLLALP